MLDGLQVTIALSLSAWVIALALGSLMGVLRTVPGKWLSGIAATYVEVFRNIPLLVQLFIWYFVLPEVLPFGLGDAFKQQLDPLTQQFVSAMLCLAFFTSARVCEQVRSGINALPRGQKNAGWRWVSRCPRPTAMCCCRWLSAWWCRRSRPSF
jgi:glutamate/aspartate transport system permease protein